MILVVGIPSEPPVAMAIAALERRGACLAVFNQRRFADAAFSFRVDAAGLRGAWRFEDSVITLDKIRGLYYRPMDPSALPEYRAADPEARARCDALHDALLRWSEITPARVANRTSAMGSNCSKPYQAQRICAHGFLTPETLITSEPDLARDFIARQRRVIYKSASGARSIAKLYAPADDERLDRIRWCPTQFQAFVEGMNVRAHVIGARVFATAIDSDAADYRYAGRDGETAELRAWDLPDDVAERCVSLAADLGLAFAGIDLKFAPDGRVYCFEANPSPGYSYYEANTGQPISNALAAYLDGEGDEGNIASSAAINLSTSALVL